VSSKEEYYTNTKFIKTTKKFFTFDVSTSIKILLQRKISSLKLAHKGDRQVFIIAYKVNDRIVYHSAVAFGFPGSTLHFNVTSFFASAAVSFRPSMIAGALPPSIT